MKIKNIIIATLAVFTVVGCTENFDELVKDPVALSPNPAGQLTFTQLCLSGDGYYQHRTNLIYAGGFVQHYSGSWAVTEYGSKFKRVDEYATALWRNAYANEIKSETQVVNSLAILNGTDILRVHDVTETKNTLTIIKTYFQA